MPHGTARTDSRAASFATSRRGGPDHYEIIRLHALGRGVQTISNITGSSMEDVARVLSAVADSQNDNAGPVARPAPLTFQDRRTVRDEQFRAMWLGNVPRDDICHALGIGATTLKSDRIRLGLNPRKSGVKPRTKSGAAPCV